MGVGAARNIKSVNLGIVREMVLTWVLTFPCCGLFGLLDGKAVHLGFLKWEMAIPKYHKKSLFVPINIISTRCVATYTFARKT